MAMDILHQILIAMGDFPCLRWRIYSIYLDIFHVTSPKISKDLRSSMAELATSIWLVVEPPLWKIWKSIGSTIPNIWTNRKCSKSPTSYGLFDMFDKLLHGVILNHRITRLIWFHANTCERLPRESCGWRNTENHKLLATNCCRYIPTNYWWNSNFVYTQKFNDLSTGKTCLLCCVA